MRPGIKPFGLLVISAVILLACSPGEPQQQFIEKKVARIVRSYGSDSEFIDPKGQTLEKRFNVPAGYERVAALPHSYAAYLRQLPLKPHGSKVLLYDGREKSKRGVYDAVVEMDIGKKDLQQCADAVMRLRAEHLWAEKQYDKIHFNFTNGFRVDYTEWMQGKRVAIKGNKTWWKQSAQPSNTYSDFRAYMELIFTYAGTLSLSRELKSVPLSDLRAGDVFIQGGSPGHALLVTDVAIDPKTGKKIFLLAQSYMPAQETQILKNPMDAELSPWYSTDFGEVLDSPEWKFTSDMLMRFEE